MKKLMLLGGAKYLLPVIEEAHRLGLYVITCDYLPDNIAHKFSDEYRNVSIIEKDAVLAVAEELQIDGIMSFACDPGVVTAAYVAEKLALPFVGSYEAVSVLQNKGLFRRFLKEHGFNVPWAKSYMDEASALGDADSFDYPAIVKPVDSAGSKGVTRVDSPEELPAALRHAMANTHGGGIIVEEFIEKQGHSSDTDCFAVNGRLDYCSFDEQHFDRYAENPYTPAAYLWPSSMPQWAQEELHRELQRLMDLLHLNGSGVYNVETRLCTNGKTYIMEFTPRGGGNRLSEVLALATGTPLVQNAVKAAVGMETEPVSMPEYRGHWAEIILHSDIDGVFKALDILPEAEGYVVQRDLWVQPGDRVERFSGANKAIGTLVMNFPDRETAHRYMSSDRWYTVAAE